MKISKKIIIRAVSIAVVIVPIEFFIFLIRHKAGNSAAYYSPLLWLCVTFSCLCGLFAYIILKVSVPKEAPSEEYEEEALEAYTEKVVDTFTKKDAEEYPEFAYGEKEEKEEKNIYSDKIHEAIAAQKKTCEEILPDTDYDDGGESFSKEAEKPDLKLLKELYENIPEELPEGYTYRESESEEEEEYFGGYTVKKISFGQSKLSKTLFCAAAFLLALLVAFACSFSLNKQNFNGFCYGGREYTFEDCVCITVGEKLFGSLSVKAEMTDGKTLELLPAGLFENKKIIENEFGDNSNEYCYVAYVVRKLKRGGARLDVIDKDKIINEYSLKEDGSLKYISEIIGAEE